MYTILCLTPDNLLAASVGGDVSSREAARRCRQLLSLKFTSRQ